MEETPRRVTVSTDVVEHEHDVTLPTSAQRPNVPFGDADEMNGVHSPEFLGYAPTLVGATPRDEPWRTPASIVPTEVSRLPPIQMEQKQNDLEETSLKTYYMSYSPNVVRSGLKGVPYEITFYILFIITTVLFTVDRFTTNVWPRDSFKGSAPGIRASFGSDPTPLKDGPWTVQAYDILARVSGRVSMCTLNVSFFTMMPVFFNWWHERSTWIDLDGWQEANARIHRVMGWLTGIMIIPHVWSVFFPIVFSGWTEVVVARPSETVFRGPISEHKACKDVDPKTETVCLDGDDIFRLCLMTLLFFVLFPLSRAMWALRQNWNLCKWLHVFCWVAYTVDITRRRSHPHTWILNLPVILAYGVDVVLGAWYYRVTPKCPIVHRVNLDGDYMLVFWKNPTNVQPWLGDVYYLKDSDSSCFERPHPFTTLNNHTRRIIVPSRDMLQPTWAGHRFFQTDDKGEGEEQGNMVLERAMTEATPMSTFTAVLERTFHGNPDLAAMQEKLQEGWDTAAIVHVYNENRGCGGGRSFTAKLADPETQHVHLSGPYRSSYRRLYNAPHLPPLVLIGSGAGGAYLVDFMGFLRECDVRLVHPVQVYYTARSLELFQFVTDHLCPRFKRPIDLVEVHAHLTKQGVEYSTTHAKNDMKVGRMDLKEIIEGAPAQAEVYFCGSGPLQGLISDLCAAKGLVFHGGHAFD